MEEVRATKGKKVDDPFTRRSTKPRMVFKAPEEAEKHVHDDGKDDLAAMAEMMATPAVNQVKEPEKKKEIKTGNTDDLFSAHNFDIKIDLEVPIPGMCFIYQITINQ